MNKTSSLIGQKFSRLFVLADAPHHVYPNGSRQRKYLCRCDCGKEVEKIAGDLKTGNTKSCGCLKIEGHVTHGYARVGKRHELYGLWGDMIGRCNNPNETKYKDYGGRGIKVCKRWRSFKNFLDDLGERPPGMTLERVDNEKGYSPSNVKWDTQSNQCRNKRSTTIYTVHGVTGCMLTLCEHFKIGFQTVSSRIHGSGWSPEKAFTYPVKTRAGVTPARVGSARPRKEVIRSNMSPST